MASIKKMPNGKWRVQIEYRGRREYKTLLTHALAKSWANQREAEIAKGQIASVDQAQRTPFAEVIDTFREKELDKRKNRSDKYVLNTLEERFGRSRLASVFTKDIAKFRDDRLKEGRAPATVVKELNLFRLLIDYAIRDMGIYLPANPARMVKNPAVNNARDRVFIADEEARLYEAFPNDNYRDIATLALETACRLGELLKMMWNDIDFTKRTLRIPKENAKTAVGRVVPLSSKAIAVLRNRPRGLRGGRVFDCWAAGDSFQNGYKRALIRARQRYEEDCKVEKIAPHPNMLCDLRFHDFRHIATSRLAKRLPNVIELSRVTGHSDLKMLSRYYHISPEELVAKLG